MADGSLLPPEALETAAGGPRTPSLAQRASAARKALGAALEHALAVLDELDGDTDLEPVNGSTVNSDQRHWAAGGGDGEREPAGDNEPSLGGFDPFGSTQDMEEEFGGLGDRTDQRRWAQDHGDGGDGAVDDEPSLGSIAETDQRYWTGGPTGKARHLDREQACEDEGAQCDDEGAPGYEGVPSYGIDQTTPLGWSIVW